MEKENNSSFMDYLKAWGRFFISRYFIKNICIFIATVLVFILLITQGLKWYTHHTEKISVPSVEGMTVAEAKKIIKERGLEAVVNDSTFECASKSIKPGQIIPGRKIYLTYLAYTKQPATMPNINGESVETAKSLILGAGLIPGKITERENPHKGLVLEAKFNGARVSAGKQLHKGDIIDLIIGKGEDNDATTPYDSDDDILNQSDDSDDE